MSRKCFDGHKDREILLIIPETAALFVPEDICKGGCIGRYPETVGLPLSGRHPGHRNVEAVQVVCEINA